VKIIIKPLKEIDDKWIKQDIILGSIFIKDGITYFDFKD